MDWIVNEAAKSQTQLSNFHFTSVTLQTSQTREDPSLWRGCGESPTHPLTW